MDLLEQENTQLREEVAALKEAMEQMNANMARMMAERPTPTTPLQTTTTSSTQAETSRHAASGGQDWGKPLNLEEVFGSHASKIPKSITQQMVSESQPVFTFPQATAAATYTKPLVHTLPHQEEEPRWYMDLEGANIRSFQDLGNAFIQQYKYNSYLAPDRDELRALTQRDKESFKEFAQRWRQLAAQIRPPLEERELKRPKN